MNFVNDIRLEFLKLLRYGNSIDDKGGGTVLEIINASFIADENSIFGDPDMNYIDREIAWYKSQSLSISDIPGTVPKIWKDVASKGGLINSNYGWCVWSESNGYQYNHCLEALLNDRNTRRASMIYTRPEMQSDFCRDGMSDFMCTNAVQYLIRDGKMHASVSMRSNDLVYGYKNDRAWAYHVLNDLIDDYNSLVLESDRVELGNIYWNVGSLHIYSKHYHLIQKFFDHEHTSG